ncbi:MAG: hypothetical protein FWF36_04665 [Propionibacteriaceae bacterium]|nr:hypothetical protein [Propionibacteriaceae bacterium]
MKTIKIDCSRCLAPRSSCDDCVVGFLLGAGPTPTLNAEEQAALAVLSRSRMVPPLRLVEPGDATLHQAA